MDTLTLPISPEEKALLHRLAETSHSSDEEIAAAALREYLRFEAAQITKINAGVEAADRAEFAGDEEVEAFFHKYGAAD